MIIECDFGSEKNFLNPIKAGAKDFLKSIVPSLVSQ